MSTEKKFTGFNVDDNIYEKEIELRSFFKDDSSLLKHLVLLPVVITVNISILARILTCFER